MMLTLMRKNQVHNTMKRVSQGDEKTQQTSTNPVSRDYLPTVIIVPRNHDYTISLCEALSRHAINLPRIGRLLNPDTVDILHIHWPGYLVNFEDFKSHENEYLNFIYALGQSSVRVVWTMHNRFPHGFDSKWSRKLYDHFAKITDGVIHHSHWGMNTMKQELPFRMDAYHTVIPVGHYKNHISQVPPRHILEHEYGFEPCSIRFGVLGRPQKEKRIDMIIRAFHTAQRNDIQLLVTALAPEIPMPDDSRIRTIPRRKWLSREEVSKQVKLCDALVCAHEGYTYLTSGLAAEAVGAGIPIVAGQWPFFKEVMGEAGIYYDDSEKGLVKVFNSINVETVESGKRASEKLQKQYDWHMVANKTMRFYRDVIFAHPIE